MQPLHDPLRLPQQLMEYNMNKLDPKIKEAWLKNLKSGEYERISGAMRRNRQDTSDKRHCCLGVLRETICELGLISVLDKEQFYAEDNGHMTHTELSILGYTFRRRDGDLVCGATLSRINDGAEKEDTSYDVVIPVIEKCL